jgi:putative SOS response-associated peptidase YedK
MCYNIAYLEHRIEKYAERYKHSLPPDWSKRTPQLELPTYYFVSGFAHPLLPIVNHEGISLYEWGLIPFWIKDAKSAGEINRKTLNAVGETVFDKPSFKKSIASQRCLLGVNGFYEWREFNNKKYPYFIKIKSNEIFSLGCIYESWADKSTGEIRNTFSILTTAANPMMEKIHNMKKRMPLIIPEKDEKKWIEPLLSKAKIQELIKPYDEADMTAYTIWNSVNNPKNNRNIPEIMNRYDYAELS